jgi:hypothetical protein
LLDTIATVNCTASMASVTSREQQHKQYLPLSPPPSPPSTRKRHKKRTDSFEKLANTPIPSPPSSPSHNPQADEDQEPLLTKVSFPCTNHEKNTSADCYKIVLTPVLFISFILSLSFVNIRDRANRTYSHSGTSFLAYLYPSSWLDPEPYQDPDNSTWGRKGATTHVEPSDAISPKSSVSPTEGGKKSKRSWHLNKKIRKMAKLEVSDAFEMRGRVIVVMLVMMALASVGLWMSGKWALASLWHVISR